MIPHPESALGIIHQGLRLVQGLELFKIDRGCAKSCRIQGFGPKNRRNPSEEAGMEAGFDVSNAQYVIQGL